MNKKVILSGYFGFDNLGDEAILYSMIQELKKEKDLQITALSSNPEKTKHKFDVEAVDRMSIFKVAKAIKQSDVFVSGGGSLFQDVTSKRSMLYYLALLFMAKTIYKKKVMIYSQGIGPVNDPKNRKKLAKAFNKVDLINVRDQESMDQLVQMGVTKPISVTADTVFLLDKPEAGLGKTMLENLGMNLHQSTIGISIRPWQEYNDKILEEMNQVIAHFQEKAVNLLLLPFHHPGDLELSQSLIQRLASKNNVFIIQENLDEKQMLSVIANTDIMLSMRLHGLIFGIVAGAYPVGISYDPKIQSLLQEICQKPAIEVENLEGQKLIQQIEEVLQTLPEGKNQVQQIANQMKTKALENIKMLKELLN